jgi:hypothetical protein
MRNARCPDRSVRSVGKIRIPAGLSMLFPRADCGVSPFDPWLTSPKETVK